MDPDLKLRVEWDAVRQAFVDAKKNRGSEEYLRAKAAMNKQRAYWRGIRDAVAEKAESTAALTTISTKASTK